jgi:type II secretory pathway component GspD/PulD (secretin)
MRKLVAESRILLLLSLCYSVSLIAQHTEIVQLKFLSPDELVSSLGLESNGSRGYKLTIDGMVAMLRLNYSNNQVLINSNPVGLERAKDLILFMDVPPRQIVIEAKIIEVDQEKLRETGIDWQSFLDNSRVGFQFNYNSDRRTQKQEDYRDQTLTDKITTSQLRTMGDFGNIRMGDVLRIVEDSQAGQVISIPKIVTTNNRKGSIIDGERITYVSRYSSYSNLYETQELSTGLSLSVTPSIGQSDYLKLDVEAKFTTLGSVIADSPSERGQILENVVVVRNGESFLLGAFKRTETVKGKRKIPILGTILPFLFSRDITSNVTKDVLIVLTPTIIDLNMNPPPSLE